MYNIDLNSNKLGSGGFGTVLECKDDSGNIYAVKVIELPDSGLVHPLEFTIMTSIQHQNLNHAKKIIYELKEVPTIYIFQDKAVYDIKRLTSVNHMNFKIPLDTLRYWTRSLVSAISCLHEVGIIHADIKAANILVFPDGNLKLSDFSVAAKKDHHNQYFTSIVGTKSHTAPEMWQGQWNESVDIWGLGCTLFEMYFGRSLFPNQKLHSKEKKHNPKVRAKFLDTIALWHDEWCKLTHNSYFLDWKDTGAGSRLNPIELPTNSSKEFLNFLWLLLTVDPKKRPTIKQLIEHPFIHPYVKIPYTIRDKKFKELSSQKKGGLKRRFKNLIKQYPKIKESLEKQLIEQSIKIYSMYPSERYTKEHDKIYLNIAHKVIKGKSIKDPIFSQKASLQLEKEIVTYLDYHFI